MSANYHPNKSGHGTNVLLPPKKRDSNKLKSQVDHLDRLFDKTRYGEFNDYVSYEAGKDVNRGVDDRYHEGHLVSKVPVRAFSKREEEENISYFRELQDVLGKDTFSGLESSEYVDFIKTRHKEQEALQYEQFMLNLFAPDDPYQMHLLVKTHPELFEKRLATVDLQCEKYEHLIKVWINGLQTEEDYALIYNISKGYETFSGEVLAKLIGFDIDSIAAAQERIESGFVDDPHLNAMGSKYDANNSIDIRKPLSVDPVTKKVTINRNPKLRPQRTEERQSTADYLVEAVSKILRPN